MAFTDAEKATLVEITGLNIVLLDNHLTGNQEFITSDIEDVVIADIALWITLRDKHTIVNSNAANFGANIDYDRNRKAIKKRVLTQLFLSEMASDRLARG